MIVKNCLIKYVDFISDLKRPHDKGLLKSSPADKVPRFQHSGSMNINRNLLSEILDFEHKNSHS
jgi:hypothetical protein